MLQSHDHFFQNVFFCSLMHFFVVPAKIRFLFQEIINEIAVEFQKTALSQGYPCPRKGFSFLLLLFFSNKTKSQ